MNGWMNEWMARQTGE